MLRTSIAILASLWLLVAQALAQRVEIGAGLGYGAQLSDQFARDVDAALTRFLGLARRIAGSAFGAIYLSNRLVDQPLVGLVESHGQTFSLGARMFCRARPLGW